MTRACRLFVVLMPLVVNGALPALCAAQVNRAGSPLNRVAMSLAQAESAFDRGDTVAAARAYAAVLVLEPNHPRALFRLAQLRRDDPDAATALLLHYVEVVPSDAWGHLALADALAQRGDATAALRAYADALAHEPEDRDIRLGGPRLLTRLGRIDTAIDAYRGWLAQHPEDGETWRELAAAQQRAGRPRSAARALESAQALAPSDPDLARRLQALRMRMAPAIQVGVLGAGETGATTSATFVGIDFPAGDRGRIGVHYQRQRVGSFDDSAHTQRLGLRASGQPRSDIHLNASAGVRWTPLPEVLATSGPRPDLAFRIRRVGGAKGLSLDAKLQRDPIDVTPELARAPVFRTQVLTAVEVPIWGQWVMRGQAGAASLTRPDERNRRTGVTGGVAVAISPELRLSGQWHRTRNSHTASRGYFAPATAEVAEIGLELEGEYDRVTLAIDAGAGVQRFQRLNRIPTGPWAPTFRVWGRVGWNVSLRQQLLLEVESYDSQISNAVLVAEHWRYASVTVSLRVALR